MATTLKDDLTLNDATALKAYILPDDGYVYYNGKIYADKLYLGCNDSEDNWEQVALTAEIYADNPQLYCEYDEDTTYETGTHLIKDGDLVVVGSDGSTSTITLVEGLTLHDASELLGGDTDDDSADD